MNMENSKKSFVSVLKCGSQLHITPKITKPALVLDETCIKEFDFGMSLMGREKYVSAIPNLACIISKEGFQNVKLSYLGGMWVLFKFDSLASKEKFPNHSGIGSWFTELIQATNSFKNDERIVWISIEGLPIKALTPNTFRKFASLWGEYVEWDNADLKSLSYDQDDLSSDGESQEGDVANKVDNNKSDVDRVSESSFMHENDTAHKDVNSCKKGERIMNSHSQKSKVGGSILDLMDELVTVGQTMGYNMAGLGNKAKRRWMKKLCQKHRINFASIQETKAKSISLHTIKDLWGNQMFDHVVGSSVGCSGGILCMWNPNMFVKEQVSTCGYFVALMGTWAPTSSKLLIIFVYVPQELNERRDLWDYLRTFIDSGKELNNRNAMEISQKAKIRWSIEGDENSKYFHGIMNKKISHLAIRGTLANEEWISEPHGIKFKIWSVVLLMKRSKGLFGIVAPTNHLGQMDFPLNFTIILPYLISDVQSAFITNRQILDGPFILNDLLSWCKFKNLNGMIFNVDFEKAFDYVKWDYLDETLKAFGFGSKWRNWISSCLNIAMGLVIVNGSPTLEFQFHKGLKQGLKINLHKSKLMGIGVSSNVVAAVASLIGCSILTAPFNYLVVKVGCSMLKITSWDDVITKTRFIKAIFGNKGALDTHKFIPRRSSWQDVAFSHYRDAYSVIFGLSLTQGDIDNSTSNVLILLDSWTSGILVYRLPLSGKWIAEYGVSTSIGYDVSSSMSNTLYSSQLINTAYPLPLDTAYRSSDKILFLSRTLRMTKVIKGEFGKIKDIKVEDVSLTCDTPLEIFNMEVSRLSGMDNYLFTCEVEVANILCNSILNDNSEYETADDMGYDPSDVAFIECWKEDGYCNRGNIPGTYFIENQLHYQDLECYEALEDSELKNDALRNKDIMEGFIDEDNEEFEMIKYSFGQDEEHVAIKEDEYNDLARTSNDACCAY
uniref:RNA-directed DNA polymerase, eukaryota n=1 Tax=Tanacetum cinerariifolium TaxID=118510 RepID=A0A6L2JU61_TANCI|nr:RNA-directed DNA polymerase, eukaryota [Tanacetum cinerariifolium]